MVPYFVLIILPEIELVNNYTVISTINTSVGDFDEICTTK
jgi:hypothetical protein